MVQRYFIVNNSGINFNWKSSYPGSIMFCRILSQRFHGEIKTQAVACVKLVETEQDIYCSSHKRDAQGFNF